MSPWFWILAVFGFFLVLTLVVGSVLVRYAPLRDEDEELMHPFGQTRLP